MTEFLIRTLSGGGWPATRQDRLAAVLTPVGWDCVPVEGWGDYRLRADTAEIAFSSEPVGWQVSICGPMPSPGAVRFVAAVATQIEHELGEPVEWLQIS